MATSVTPTPSEDLTDEEAIFIAIPFGAPARLDKALAVLVPEEAALSRSRLARMIEEGAVTRNGAPALDGKAKVTEGDVYRIQLDPAVSVETLPEDIPLSIIWEDGDLIVIDKPAGMVVHPAPGTPRGTLVNALLFHCGDTLSGIGGERRPGIVHRIDKDTTGLLVVAKSDRAHHGLAKQFEEHTVARRYLAVVNGTPAASDPRLRGLRGITVEAGGIIRIATELARHKTDRQRQAVVWDGIGRHAVTRIRVMEDYQGRCTGRMLVGDRAHPSDPGPHGLCRAWADRRSDLWRHPQAGAQAFWRGGRVGQYLPASGAPCRDFGV
jgi:23S rRNA pseudouridine1911/1915/1917 synthase